MPKANLPREPVLGERHAARPRNFDRAANPVPFVCRIGHDVERLTVRELRQERVRVALITSWSTRGGALSLTSKIKSCHGSL